MKGHQLTKIEQKIERLTQKAKEAAEQGQWGTVAQFYASRARAGSLDKVSRDVAETLMQYDQWVMARIREVQSLIQQQLGEAQQHRRKLDGVKRQWASQNLVQARHRLSI